MNHKILSSLSIALATIITLSGCNSTTTINQPSHQNQMIQPTTTSDHSAHPSWTYEGNTGPSRWGDQVGNKLCKTGLEQSPINIEKVLKTNEKAPLPNYKVSDIEIENNGHTVVFTPHNNKNSTIINDEAYTLKQFHYHTPSEHQIAGVNYPGELHFVHTNAKGNLAVLGVMVNPTAVNSTTLTKLLESSVVATNRKQSILEKAVDLNKLLPARTAFYSYAGSLTTPPCSERVKWYVATTPLSVTAEELKIMQQLFSNNNRPVVPMSDRVIKLIK